MKQTSIDFFERAAEILICSTTPQVRLQFREDTLPSSFLQDIGFPTKNAVHTRGTRARSTIVFTKAETPVVLELFLPYLQEGSFLAKKARALLDVINNPKRIPELARFQAIRKDLRPRLRPVRKDHAI